MIINTHQNNLWQILSKNCRKNNADVTNLICNAFTLVEATKTCTFGAYEKNKGFTEMAGAATFMDMGKNK